MKRAKSSRHILVLLALSVFLAACQLRLPGADSADLEPVLGKVDPRGALVVFWHSLSGADEDRLLEMIDDFNASNEWRITVVGEYQGDVTNIYNKVMAGIPADKVPSLVMTDNSLTAAYAAQGLAIPISPYLQSERWGMTPAEQDDYFPDAFAADRLPQFGNQLYSFPSCRSLQILYYNVDWLKELGFDEPPGTWAGFREMACTASNPFDGVYGFELGMDSSVFNSLLATQDIPLLATGGTAYNLGSEGGRSTLQFLQSAISDGCITWETEQGPLEDFGAGRILFTIDSTDQLAAYEDAVARGANFEWSFSELPHTTDEPLVGVDGVSMTVLRTTPGEQLAAWLFIKWFADATQQAGWAQQMGCYPTRRSALDEMETYLEEHPRYSQASQLLEQNWIAEPGVTAYATCRGEIGRMLYAVTAGESVDQWLQETLRLCNQALKDTMH
jgi:multiple sugar transport system substrate-binding protein